MHRLKHSVVKMAFSWKTCCYLSCLGLLFGISAASAQDDVASFAVNTVDKVGSMETARFDGLTVNRFGLVDQETWRMWIPFSGLYLISLSAGYPGNGLTYYSLQSMSSRITSIYRDTAATVSRATVLGKDIIVWFPENQEIFIRSDGPRLGSTVSGLATSWGTFSLSHSMGTDVGFGAARTTVHGPGKVTFDTTWGNVGNGWNTASSTFIAPTTGIYYFSFSTGVSSGQTVNMHLRVNGNNFYRIYRNTNTPVNLDSLQRAVMLYLSVGDNVEVVSDHFGNSNNDCLTTLSGFMYNTSRDYRQAWAVSHSTTTATSYSAFPFQHVEVNEGGGWQDHQALCLYTGLYYVHVSAVAYQSSSLLFTIMRGSQAEGELRYNSPSMYETVSRSLIIRCTQGETIKVAKAGGYVYSASTERDINFLGFYLFP